MSMNSIYQIAGHIFEVSGENLCAAVAGIEGFRPFVIKEGEPAFRLMEGKGLDVPIFEKVEYCLAYEGVKGTFGLGIWPDVGWISPESKTGASRCVGSLVQERRRRGLFGG